MVFPKYEHTAACIFAVLVFVSLLLFYTAYDKATKALVPEKLLMVATFQDVGFSLGELNKVLALESIGLISLDAGEVTTYLDSVPHRRKNAYIRTKMSVSTNAKFWFVSVVKITAKDLFKGWPDGS